MTYKIAIDADSILYKSCYNAQLVDKKTIDVIYSVEEREESFDLEKAYRNFCSTITGIENMVFTKHKDEHVAGQWRGEDIIHGLDIEMELIFSPKHTLRHDLTKT